MPVNGLVKYKFYDFVVNEIYNGVAVDLTTPAPHSDLFMDSLNFFKDPNYVHEVTLDLNEIDSIVKLDEEVSKQLKQFLRESKPNSKFSFPIPQDCDKLQRTAIHAFFKLLKNPLLQSSTGEGVINMHFHSKMQIPNNPDKQRYLNFIMLKQDIDTMQACSLLASLSQGQKLRPNQFQYCGIKDQRGVTQQLVQIPGYVFPEALTQQLPANIKLGNFQGTELELYPGSHDGNQFKLVVRCLGDVPTKQLPLEIVDNLKTLQSQGMLNKFGYQRFGTGLIKTDVMGAFVAQEDYQNFFKAYVINDFTMKNDITEEEKQAILKYFAKFELKEKSAQPQPQLPEDEAENNKTEIEALIKRFAEVVKETGKPFMLKKVLQGVNLDNLDERGIIQAIHQIPDKQRTFYFHAFQSRIFNTMVDNLPKYEKYMLERNGEKVFELIGFNSVAENPQLQEILDIFGVKAISKKYRDLTAPGGVRKIYVPVKELSFQAVFHDEKDVQLQSTKFEAIPEEVTLVDNVENLVTSCDTEKYCSLLMKFNLEGSCYATEVISVLLGQEITKEKQMDMI